MSSDSHTASAVGHIAWLGGTISAGVVSLGSWLVGQVHLAAVDATPGRDASDHIATIGYGALITAAVGILQRWIDKRYDRRMVELEQRDKIRDEQLKQMTIVQEAAATDRDKLRKEAEEKIAEAKAEAARVAADAREAKAELRDELNRTRDDLKATRDELSQVRKRRHDDADVLHSVGLKVEDLKHDHDALASKLGGTPREQV